MKILIDTREQSPLEFKHENVTDTCTKTLKVGDYGCEYKLGYIPPVFFERKSIGDLFGSMGKGYPRFKRELQRAECDNVKLILIIEGTLTKTLKGAKYSRMKGKSIVKKLFTLWIKYGLYPVFCKDRKEMSRYICEYYAAIGRKAMHDLKHDKQRVQAI